MPGSCVELPCVLGVGSGCYFDMFFNKVGECARFGTRPLARNQLHLLRVSRNDVLQHKPTFRKCCLSKYLSATSASGMCECEEMLTCVQTVRMGRLYGPVQPLCSVQELIGIVAKIVIRLRRLERVFFSLQEYPVLTLLSIKQNVCHYKHFCMIFSKLLTVEIL